MSLLDELAMAWRFGAGLPRFLGDTVDAETGAQRIEAAVRERGQSFLRLLDAAVFRNPRSPYLPLFANARLRLPDVAALVNGHGVEAALAALYAEGVRITLDEFKAHSPIRRGGVEIAARPESFDNPVLSGHFVASTGGSTGARRRLIIDLDLLTADTAPRALFLKDAGLRGAPFALWRPAPPGAAGIKRALDHLKAGERVARWFSQSAVPHFSKSGGLLATAYVMARVAGQALPYPEYTPESEARRVAEWLARHRPAHLDTNVSGAIRVCQAGVDIAGSYIRTGSEPLTPSRARIITNAGCRVSSFYAMAECGPITMACPHAHQPDAGHLLSYKMAVITPSAGGVQPLYLTTLSLATPKVMINVESGDEGSVEPSTCACSLHAAGLTTLVHSIRSYDKLTSEGMHFTAGALHRLIEETLPQLLNATPIDFQLVETDEHGIARVTLLVHPRLGAVDEARVVNAMLETLAGETAGGAMMAELWRDAGTLRVRREAPSATGEGKVLPLRHG